MTTKGTVTRKRLSVGDIAEQERRIEELRVKTVKAGGRVEYARKVGMSSKCIASMLSGMSRVSDRALGGGQ